MIVIKYKLILVALISGICFTLSAGRYAGDFMMIGSGVRALGMGGAFAAIADDGNAIYWNASGISQIKEPEVTLMHAFLYKGLASFDNVSYCQPLPNDVTIGINLTRLTIDDIPKFNESYLIGYNVDERINNSLYHLPGVPDGYLKSTDDLYQFAFSKHLKYNVNLGWLFFAVPVDTHLGANIKYIKRQIGNDRVGTGTGFDLSFMFKTDMSTLFDVDDLGSIRFAFNLQDVGGTEITWSDADNFRKDEVLFNTKVGIAVMQPLESLKSTITCAYDFDYVYQYIGHAGFDWDYDNKANLRLGYYYKNITAGASINVYGVYIDYAAITNTLGLTNRIGLRMNF